jgi:poly(glycerol-phosphate) alpha-glucosyltransferase
LARALADAGVAVEAFGAADGDWPTDRPAWSPTLAHAFEPLPPKRFGWSPEIDAALDRCAADLVHVHGLWAYPSLAALAWGRRTGRPNIVSPHGMLDPWALANSRAVKAIAAAVFERPHLTRAACVHALCGPEAAAIRAFGLRNPVAVVPNGVDLPDLTAPAPPAPWTPAVEPGRRVLLFLGRLHPKKNLPALLRAWAALPDAVRGEWTLVIAGWDQGGHEAELRRLTGELGIAGGVHFAGPLFGADKAAALRNAGAFVLPSLSEGLPMAVLEAWSYGLPVLMTAACNLAEGFAAGGAAEIPADGPGLVAGLRAFLDRSDRERTDMGAAGRRLAAERFSWRSIAGRMRAVYDWVLGGGPPPDCVRMGRGAGR